MPLHEYFLWTGLISWVGSVGFISVIALRRMRFLVLRKWEALTAEMNQMELKLAKASGIFFVLGTVLFIVGDSLR